MGGVVLVRAEFVPARASGFGVPCVLEGSLAIRRSVLEPGVAGTEGRLASMRWKVLMVRAVLGICFAFLLARFFFPGAGQMKVLAIAGLLVFFAYLLESIHQRNQ